MRASARSPDLATRFIESLPDIRFHLTEVPAVTHMVLPLDRNELVVAGSGNGAPLEPSNVFDD